MKNLKLKLWGIGPTYIFALILLLTAQRSLAQPDSVLSPYDLGPAYNTSPLPLGTLYRDNKGYAAIDTPVLAPTTSATRLAATYSVDMFRVTFMDEALSNGIGFNDPTVISLAAGHPLGTSTTLGALREWTAMQAIQYIDLHLTFPSGQNPKICFLKSGNATAPGTVSSSLATFQINYPAAVPINGAFDGGSLANKILSGTSTTSPYDAYITIDFSNNAWYILDVASNTYVTRNINSDAYNTSPGSDIDLYSVVLQQATHALGINSLINSHSQVGVSAIYTKYDHYLTAGPLFTVPNQLIIDPTYHSLINDTPKKTNGVQYTNTANAKNYAVYSPGTWADNFSLSYLSAIKDVYPYESSEIYSGGYNRDWTFAEKQILCNLGYSIVNFANFSCSDHLPVGVNDLISTTANTPATMDVTLNDVDPDGQAISVLPGSVQLLSDHGSVSLSGNSITFTPDGLSNEYAYIQYIPYTPVNGASGPPAYMIVTVTGGSRAFGDPCNLIENGSFENGMSLAQFNASINSPTNINPTGTMQNGAAPPWIAGSASPTVYFTGSLFNGQNPNASYGNSHPYILGIPINYFANTSPGVSTFASGERKYAGIAASVKAGHLGGLVSEGFYQQLIQPLQTGTNYTLTFNARAMCNVNDPYETSCQDAYVRVSFTTGVPAFSPSNYVPSTNVFTSPVIVNVPSNSTITPASNTWTQVSIPVNVSTSGLAYISIEGQSAGGHDDEPYIFVDNFRLVKNGAVTPSVTITPPSTSVCQGTSVTLTALGTPSGGTYTWNTGATTAAITFTPTGTAPYTVNYTSTDQCTASISANVTVKPLPAVGITPSSPSVCLGASTTLTASGGGTYLWSNGATTASITVSPTVTTNYCVTVTLNGCTASGCVTVTVKANPTASISPASTTICSGTSTPLTASGGGTYLWSTAATTAGITVSPATTTTYCVTVTAANGCSASACAPVSVIPSPTAAITPPAVSICKGLSTTLTASGGGTYLWSTGATTAPVTVSPTLTTTYCVTVTATNGCSNTACATVTVNTLPNVSISPSTYTLCSGSSVTLTASGSGTSYTWNTGDHTAPITVSPSTTTTYTVTATNASGCTASTSATVTVVPGVRANAGGAFYYNACTTGCITLGGGQGTPATAATAMGGTGSYSYTWSPALTGPNPCVSVGAATYSLTVTDLGNGCSATSSATVALSPSGYTQVLDGHDDIDARVVSDLVSDNSGSIYAVGRFYNDINFQQPPVPLNVVAAQIGQLRTGLYIAKYAPCNGMTVNTWHYESNQFIQPCTFTSGIAPTFFDNICAHPYNHNVTLDQSGNVYSAASAISSDVPGMLITKLPSTFATGGAATFSTWVPYFIATDIESDPQGNIYVAGYNANTVAMTLNGVSVASHECFVGQLGSGSSLTWNWLVKPATTAATMKYDVDGALSLGTFKTGTGNYLIISSGKTIEMYKSTGTLVTGSVSTSSITTGASLDRSTRIAVIQSGSVPSRMFMVTGNKLYAYTYNTTGTIFSGATSIALPTPNNLTYDVKTTSHDVYVMSGNMIFRYSTTSLTPSGWRASKYMSNSGSATYTSYLSPDYSALDRCLTFDGNFGSTNYNLYMGGSGTKTNYLKLDNGTTTVSVNPNMSFGFIIRLNDNSGTFFKTDETDITGFVPLTQTNGVTVFPNPFSKQLHFMFDLADPEAEVSIYDIAGRLVRRTVMTTDKNETHTLDLSDLSNAMYEVRISSRTGTLVQKAIKVEQ